MNILIFSWRGPGHPNAGGAETSTHEHAKGWVKAGHQVTLFTSYFAGAKQKEIVDGVEIVRSGDQVLGVHWEALIWYLFKSHPKYDLVIDQFHGIPFFTPLYVREKKLAFIHEVAKEVWKFNEWHFPLNILIALIGQLVEPLMFKLYKKIPFMTVSESTKNDLINWGISKDNIKVIHNGVNIPELIKIQKEKDITITFLGALSKDKGIEKTLEIFDYLQKRYPQKLHFWVIGRGDSNYLKFLRKKAENLKIKSIKFWGFVTEEAKFRLLAKSHLLINTSIREGWGLVVIEAANMGTPTIAFDVPGLRDSIIDEKTGIVDKQHTIKSISEKIIDLIDHKEQYQRMREEAIIWGRKFSWKKSSLESLRLIEKMLVK